MSLVNNPLVELLFHLRAQVRDMINHADSVACLADIRELRSLITELELVLVDSLEN